MNRTVNQPIRYAIVPCTLGRLLVAATARGVCAVSLADDDAELLAFLREEFPSRDLACEPAGLKEWSRAIVRLVDGVEPAGKVPIDPRGTPFQLQVWQALCKIPRGQTRSYRAIAEALGHVDSARAVARACATNPIAVIVPCHRVIRSDGGISGYRWGVHRKEAILEREKQS